MLFSEKKVPFWMQKSKSQLDVEHDVQKNFLNLFKTNEVKQKTLKKKTQLCNMMYKDFWEIRDNYGLGDSPLHSSDENEAINNAALKELRPKNTSKNMKEFLTLKSNSKSHSVLINKNKRRKSMSKLLIIIFLAISNDKKVNRPHKKNDLNSTMISQDNLKAIHRLYQVKRLGSAIGINTRADLKKESNKSFTQLGDYKQILSSMKLDRPRIASKAETIAISNSVSPFKQGRVYNQMVSTFYDSRSHQELKTKMAARLESSKLGDNRSTLNLAEKSTDMGTKKYL